MPRTQIDPYVWRLESTPPPKKKRSVGSYRCTPQKKTKKKPPRSPPFSTWNRGEVYSLPFLVKAVILSFLIINPQCEVVVLQLHPKWLNEFYYAPGPPEKKKINIAKAQNGGDWSIRSFKRLPIWGPIFGTFQVRTLKLREGRWDLRKFTFCNSKLWRRYHLFFGEMGQHFWFWLRVVDLQPNLNLIQGSWGHFSKVSLL